MSEAPQERQANVVLTADVDAYNRSMRQASTQTSGLSQQIDDLAKSLDRLSKSTGTKMQLFGAGTAAGIVGVTAAYASFEKQMSNLQAQAAVTNRSFDQSEQAVNKLRRGFPVTTQAAAELVRTLNGLKDGTANVNDLAETFTRLGAATGESTTVLTQGLLSLQRQMGTTQRDTGKYANALTELSQKNGVAASSILDFSAAIAPIGRIAGMTQTEIMGVSTAFTKAGQDGYAAGNAFNKMLTDIMQATQSGSPDLAKYANLIGVTTDNFAKMDKTQAITQIFSELNRLGPNAIQVLNRMGLDGMRTMRAIAGVTQQTGGIAKQITEARAAYGDTGSDNALGRGSQAAVGGLSDALQRLGNSSKQIGEGLGKNFAPVATAFVNGVNAMASAAAKLVDGPLGTMGTLLGTIASAAGLVGGTLLKFAGPLATIATGYALTHNAFTGGLTDRLRGRVSQSQSDAGMPGQVSRYLTGIERNRLGPVGQAMHGAGGFIGGFLPTPGAGGGPSLASRIAGLPLHGAAAGLNFLGMGYDPLKHPFDPVNREQVFAAGGGRAAFKNFAANAPGNLGQGAGMMASARANMGAAWDSTVESAKRGFSGVGSGAAALSKSFLSFNAGLARATAGLAVLATRATGSLMSGPLRAAGSGISNFLGGPIGIGLTGAMLGYAGMQAWKSQSNMQGVVGPGTDNTSLMDTYRTAVGAATTATYDFAQAMKDATKATAPTTTAEAMRVRAQDIGTAQTRDYTNPAIAQLGDAGVANLVSSAFTGKETPAAIQELKLDLLKKYQDADKVNSMLETASKNKGKFDFQGYINEIAAGGGGALGQFRTTDDQQKYYQNLDAELKNRAGRAGVTGGTGAFQVQTRADFNALIGATMAKQPGLGANEAEAQSNFLKQQFLGGKGGRDLFAGVGTGGNQRDNVIKTYQKLLDQEGDNAKAVDELFGRMGLRRQDVATILKGGTAAGMDLNKLVQNNASVDLAKLDEQNLTGPEQTARRIAATRAGGAVQGLAQVKAAIQAPGDVNAQLQAVDAMVAKLSGMGMSAADVQKELINLKAASSDTSDPLYQLAAAAQQSAAKLNSFQNAFKPPGQQYALAGAQFQAVMGANTGPEGEQERKAALDTIRQQTIDSAMFFKQQVVNQREFTISRSQAQTDFDTQRFRNDRNYNLQQSRQAESYHIERSRGEADYSLSRARNFEDYNLQRLRGEQNYNLQIKRTLEDYNTSRKRGEYDFQLSRSRAEYNFNLSMKDSYADFKTSKLRSEQDFNHQVVLMVEQSAKSMMNIYERVTVQRTWSAASLLQNAVDQNQRASEQKANLDKARGMGLSSDVIKQLGLTDSANAQQLARLVADMANDPSLVQQWNKTIADRLKAGGNLVKDQDNTAWTEMNRQYQLSLKRGEEDFNKSRTRALRDYKRQLAEQAADYRTAIQRGQEDLQRMLARSRADYTRSITQGQQDFGKAMGRAADDYNKMMKRSSADYARSIAQQVHDYNVSIGDMVHDFELQMTRSQDQFTRMANDLSMSLEDILAQATKKLRGNLGKEAQLMMDTWKKIKDQVLQVSGQLKGAVDNQWGFTFGNLPKPIGVKAPGLGGGAATTTAPVKDQPQVPITGGHITTPFGKRGSMWASGYHTGDDYAAPTGTAIHASLAGKVMSTGWGGPYGNLTKVAVAPGIETWYAHQSSIGVKPGQHVNEGQTIGKVGATGNVTGAHLHFEVRQNGSPVNPNILGKMLASGQIGSGMFTMEQQYAFEQMIKNSPWTKWFTPGQLSGYLNNKAGTAQPHPGATAGTPGHGPANPSGNQKIVQSMAAARGWGGMWGSLYSLLMGESGFNNLAQNPTSTAYGMFQFLNSTWATVGGRKTSDPTLQTKYGLDYIARSYGDPGNAYYKWSHRSPHWYGDGSLFTSPQTIGVGERGPEAVIPLNAIGVDFIAGIMAKLSPGLEAKRGNTRGGSVPTVQHNTYASKVDASTNFSGPITVMASDPNKMAEELRLKKRRRALTSPALGGNRAV